MDSAFVLVVGAGGLVVTQGKALPLNGVHHFTLRNLNVEGDDGSFVLTGGSNNRILDSSTGARTGTPRLELINEHGDVLRGNTTVDECQILLDHSSRNRIVGNAAGELDLIASNRNIVIGNTVGATCNMGPVVGLEGTGNRNVIVGNSFRGTNTLTGFGNVLLYNAFRP